MDFRIVRDAGITQEEFAQLVPTSRVTVNLWVRGKMNPAAEKQPRVEMLLNRIEQAVVDNRLPIGKTPRTSRKERLNAALMLTAE